MVVYRIDLSRQLLVDSMEMCEGMLKVLRKMALRPFCLRVLSRQRGILHRSLPSVCLLSRNGSRLRSMLTAHCSSIQIWRGSTVIYGNLRTDTCIICAGRCGRRKNKV